jgi:hypothetical protein
MVTCLLNLKRFEEINADDGPLSMGGWALRGDLPFFFDDHNHLPLGQIRKLFSP